MQRALILTDNAGQIKDRDMLDLYDGFLALNVPTEFYTETKMYTGHIVDRDCIVLGHVGMCRHAMSKLGIAEPNTPDYPEQLKNHFGRKIRKMLFSECKKIFLENEKFGVSYFVKPTKNKLFTGFCCSNYQDLIKAATVSNEQEVYVSSVVNFGAEFRVYVYQNKIIDVFRYWGDDWSAVINRPVVEEMVGLIKDHMPIFYSLDVGVTDKNETLLVEVNDGYALGNYGLGPKRYAEMSMARWLQIIGK